MYTAETISSNLKKMITFAIIVEKQILPAGDNLITG